MDLTTLLPDGTLNGVEVVYIAAVLALALFARVAFERADREREREARRQARREDAARRERMLLLDERMDDLFGPDAFAFPRRR
jgi:hypothetical protein